MCICVCIYQYIDIFMYTYEKFLEEYLKNCLQWLSLMTGSGVEKNNKLFSLGSFWLLKKVSILFPSWREIDKLQFMGQI